MKCDPGCQCGRHTSGACKPGCVCPRHKKCEAGCACSRHTPATAQECKPGCSCGRHKHLSERGQWAGEGAGSRSRHKRVTRRRGNAAEHECARCVEGGVATRARDWAQIHGTDGNDPWADFVSLCRPCHLRYDRDARLNPASRAKKTAAAKARWAVLSPEAREKRLAGIKRKRPITPDETYDTGAYAGRC